MSSPAYFSNQSQSRFLANAMPTGIVPNNNAGAAIPAPNNEDGGTGKSRTGSSKHFSTSIDDRASTGAKSAIAATNNASNGVNYHPLRHTWVFWFRQQRSPGNKIISYEDGIKKISSFSSVESFWSLWTHLTPPSALQPTTDYLLFHTGIRRPVWEDPLNITGGKWIIRLKKGIVDRLWEDLILAIIGDQFDEPLNNLLSQTHSRESTGDSGYGDESSEWPAICGCTISVRQSEDIISIWNRYEADNRVREQIRDTIRKVLNLSPATVMEYKTNNDSMQDKSSFRTTPLTPTTATAPAERT